MKDLLSEIYAGACSRIQQAGSDLYEALHKDNGDPIGSRELVVDIVGEYRKWLLIEVDLIREAVREYEEKGGG